MYGRSRHTPQLDRSLEKRRQRVGAEGICHSYEPFLHHLAIRLGVPEHHVPDIVQQVLLAIVNSVDGWEDDGNTASFRRWLATVSRNLVIKFTSRERRQAGGTGSTDVLELLQKIPASPDREQLNLYEHELIVWAAEQVQNEFIDSSSVAFWATQRERGCG